MVGVGRMSIKLWRLDGASGRYEEQRECADDTAAEWLKRYQKDDPGCVFVLSKKRPPDAAKSVKSQAASEKRHADAITKKYHASMAKAKRLARG